MSFHKITVEKLQKGFLYQLDGKMTMKGSNNYVLCNNGEVCGARLFKGEDKKDPKQQWPFGVRSDWMVYKNKGDAETAADKLQSYLDHREAGKSK